MKVLFLTYDFPLPATSGGKVRAYNLIKQTAKAVDIYLFSFTRGPVPEHHLQEMKKIGVKEITVFLRKKIMHPANSLSLTKGNSIFKALYYDKKVEDQLINLITTQHINILHCESYYTSFYANKAVKETGVKIVFGTENIESHVYKEYVENNVSMFLKPLYNAQVKKIYAEEIHAMKVADSCLAVTSEEVEYIKKNSNTKSFVVKNGINVEKFVFIPKKSNMTKNILFVGNFTYFPNTDAMKFFMNNVWENVRDENVTLTIVGKGATRLYGNQKNVITKEYIKDINDEYEKADVFIFPVRLGGGTNFKVIEAMAKGVPVVGFADKIKATSAVEGTHYVSTKDASDFSDKIKYVFNNEEEVKKITQDAKKLIEEEFTWDKIGKELIKAWKETL